MNNAPKLPRGGSGGSASTNTDDTRHVLGLSYSTVVTSAPPSPIKAPVAAPRLTLRKRKSIKDTTTVTTKMPVIDKNVGNKDPIAASSTSTSTTKIPTKMPGIYDDAGRDMAASSTSPSATTIPSINDNTGRNQAALTTTPATKKASTEMTGSSRFPTPEPDVKCSIPSFKMTGNTNVTGRQAAMLKEHDSGVKLAEDNSPKKDAGAATEASETSLSKAPSMEDLKLTESVTKAASDDNVSQSQQEYKAELQPEQPKKKKKVPTGKLIGALDPDCVAATDLVYVRAKQERKDDPRPASMTGNGLLDAFNAANKKRDQEAAKSKGIDAAPSLAGLSKMGALVQATARSASRQPKPDSQRVAEFTAGRPISLDSPSRDTNDTKTKASSKPVLTNPIIKFDHNHGENCPGWINTYDAEAQAREDMRPKQSTYLPRTREKPWVMEWEAQARTEAEAEAEAQEQAAASTSNSRNTHMRGGSSASYNSQTGNFSSYDGDDECGYSEGDGDDDDYNSADEYHQLYYPMDDASYSQAKTWVSEEEKARSRFRKAVANFHHARMDYSPALPSNGRDYYDLKIDAVESRICSMKKRVREYEMQTERKIYEIQTAKDPKATCQSSEARLSKKLDGIVTADGLSHVLCRQSVWHPSMAQFPQCDWPTLKELKEEGELRARGRYRRFLPLPRTRNLAAKHAHLAQGPNAIPWEGEGVPFKYREISPTAAVPRNDLVFPCEGDQLTYGTMAKAPKITYGECNSFLQDLIDHIDNEAFDDIKDVNIATFNNKDRVRTRQDINSF